jgi:formate dehydrogenase subunit gamma
MAGRRTDPVAKDSSRPAASVLRAARLGGAAVTAIAAFGLLGVLLVETVTSGTLHRLRDGGARAALVTLMGEDAFWVVVALVLTVVGAASAHFGVFGGKHFSHDGQRFKYFPVAVRIVHLVAALSCTTLILTGAMMLAAAAPTVRELLEGSGLVRLAWHIHGIAAIVFAASALFLLAQWASAMLPRKHDLAWLKIAGGYLSAAKRPIPAHKFNFGQKMWFWVGTAGGLVMGTTGLLMHLFVGGAEFLNLVALVHHVVATAIIAMLGVHIYMVLFAVKGSIRSMIDGHKSEEEVAIMHSLYYAELTAGASGREVAPSEAGGIRTPPSVSPRDRGR